jgi:methylenetetrahydrofolate reductase (NADPH)
MRISVELIPRGEAELLSDARTVRSVMPQASAFNIPDLMRFPLRSWDACRLTSRILPASIPHIRAIDIPPGGDLSIAEAIQAAGLGEVLVIRGDPPHDMSHRTYPNSSEEIIRRFKRRCPAIRVYAAFDPYSWAFATRWRPSSASSTPASTASSRSRCLTCACWKSARRC